MLKISQQDVSPGNAGRATDLTVHHHGASVSLAEAAPATAARGASPHRRARTVSGRALRPHAERPSARRRESRQREHEFYLRGKRG